MLIVTTIKRITIQARNKITDRNGAAIAMIATARQTGRGSHGKR
jgi:hypothetical protein